MSKIANYIELPSDKNGNRAYTNAQATVIRAESMPGEGIVTLRVIEPVEFADNWPTVKKWDDIWVEVDNLAGAISESRYAELVMNIPGLPEWMYTAALKRKAYEIAVAVTK